MILTEVDNAFFRVYLPFHCFIFLVHSLLQWNPKLLKGVSFWIIKKVEIPSKLQELKKISLVEHQQT